MTPFSTSRWNASSRTATHTSTSSYLREPATLVVTGSDPATGCDIGHCVGTRSAGDILVSINFTQGGVLGRLEVRVWVGDAATGSYELQTLPAGSVGFVTNTIAIDCGDWDCRDSTGATQGQLDPSAFVEGYLNVSGVLGTASVGCYSTYVAQTRTSQSFESELKDFSPLGSFVGASGCLTNASGECDPHHHLHRLGHVPQ